MSIWSLRGGIIQGRRAFVYYLNDCPVLLRFAPVMIPEAIAAGITPPDAERIHADELARYARTYPDARNADGRVLSARKPKLKFSIMWNWQQLEPELQKMTELHSIDTSSKKTTATKTPQRTKPTKPTHQPAAPVLALPARTKYVAIRVIQGTIIQELRRFPTAAAAHAWCNTQPDEYIDAENFMDVYHEAKLDKLRATLRQTA